MYVTPHRQYRWYTKEIVFCNVAPKFKFPGTPPREWTTGPLLYVHQCFIIAKHIQGIIEHCIIISHLTFSVGKFGNLWYRNKVGVVTGGSLSVSLANIAVFHSSHSWRWCNPSIDQTGSDVPEQTVTMSTAMSEIK